MHGLGIQSRLRRSGFTLIELAGAAAVLSVAIAITVQLLGWVAAERREAARRQWALREADNLLERVSAWQWDQVTTERLAAAPAAKRIRSALPDGRLAVAVVENGGAKRIAIAVRWKGRHGLEQAPVRLSAWVQKRGEAAE